MFSVLFPVPSVCPDQPDGYRLPRAWRYALVTVPIKMRERTRCTGALEIKKALDLWLERSHLASNPSAPLFPSFGKNHRETIESRRLDRRSVLKLVEKRARTSGILKRVRCHSFRATGVTEYMNSGGTIELAQRIAGQPRLTIAPHNPFYVNNSLALFERPTLSSLSSCLTFNFSHTLPKPRIKDLVDFSHARSSSSRCSGAKMEAQRP